MGTYLTTMLLNCIDKFALVKLTQAVNCVRHTLYTYTHTHTHIYAGPIIAQEGFPKSPSGINSVKPRHLYFIRTSSWHRGSMAEFVVYVSEDVGSPQAGAVTFNVALNMSTTLWPGDIYI